jgi:hypothetical protein
LCRGGGGRFFLGQIVAKAPVGFWGGKGKEVLRKHNSTEEEKKAFSAKPGRRHAKQRGPHVGRVVGEGFCWEGLSRKGQGASQEGRGKEMRENEKTRK